MNITPVVKQLLIINVIFFIGSQFAPLADELFALYNPQNNHFQYWQVITHMFMHGSVMHIAFNMFALYSFGSALEHFWGGKKFIFFYISCGLGAALLQLGVNYFELYQTLKGAADLELSNSLMHKVLNLTTDDHVNLRPDLFEAELRNLLQDSGKVSLLNRENFASLFNAASLNQVPMVGASGAIYGLLVAFAFMFPNAELMMIFLPIPIKAKYFVPAIIGLDLFLGVAGNSLFGDGPGGVAHFAHIGGAIIGFIMMWYWKKNQFNDRRWN